MDTTMDDSAPAEPALNEAAQNDFSDGGLLSRVKVIEDQPLGSRASAYGQVHDELRQRLEGTDRRNG